MKEAKEMEGRGRAQEPGMFMEMLSGEECLQLRSLWEEVFFEDSEAFTAYYFAEKAERNLGFVWKDQQIQAVSMLYLSPYQLRLRVGKGFRTELVDYIVGVATKKEHRKKGYMDALLRKALYWMYQQKRPFTFLMPADPKIYQPYQFAYIYRKEKYRIHVQEEGWGADQGREAFSEYLCQTHEEYTGHFLQVYRAQTEQDWRDLAEFANAYLEKYYDVFMERSPSYYRGMDRELAVQNGGILLYRNKETGAVTGCLLYSREEAKPQVQEVMLEEELMSYPVIPLEEKEPVIMARIVDVAAFLSLLRSKGQTMEWLVEVRDPILTQNQGLWRCLIGTDAAKVCLVSGNREVMEARQKACVAKVEGLVSWAFGYSGAGECFLSMGEGLYEQENRRILDQICHMKQVFINEIV